MTSQYKHAAEHRACWVGVKEWGGGLGGEDGG